MDIENNRQQAINEYYKNPNICIYCGQVIEVKDGMKISEVKRKKFCNSSCFAKFNNRNRKIKSKDKPKFICLNCGKENILNKNSFGKFCDNKCQQEYKHKQYIERWKQGIENGIKGKFGLSQHIRKYLLEKNNYKCEKCGWSGVNPYTNKSVLCVHHIDGNYANNNEDNLMLLCPNCHSLTENYGAHNKKGRTKRVKELNNSR